MSRALLAVLLCLAAVVPSAEAVARPHRPAVPPMPPYVTYIYERPPGWAGPFTAAAAGATIYRARDVDRFTLSHERGHVFDYEVLTDADRAFFTRLMHLHGPWTQEGGYVLGVYQGGEQSPDEWFADWYANGRMRCGPTLGNCWTLGYAESPRTDRQFRRFLARVRSAARRYAVRSEGERPDPQLAVLRGHAAR